MLALAKGSVGRGGRSDGTAAAKTGEKSQAEGGAQVVPRKGPQNDAIEKLRRWTCAREPGMRRSEAIRILTEWSEADPSAALEFVAAAPRFPGRNGALAVPLAVICQRNPGDAIGWMQCQVAEPEQRGSIAAEVIDAIREKAPLQALALADAAGIPVADYWFGELLGRAAQLDPRAALTSFGLRSPEGRREVMGRMLAGWAEKEPGAALAWYLAQTDRNENAAESLALACLKSGKFGIEDLRTRLQLSQSGADALLWGLARDGKAVDARTLASFSPEARLQAARAAAVNLEDDPEKVLAFTRSAVAPDQRAEALTRGLERWMNSDRKAAEGWLAALPDQELAQALSAKMERVKLLDHPTEALRQAELLSSPADREAVVQSALSRLAWQSPAEAAAWVSQHPDAPSNPEAVVTIAEDFLESDDAGAMEWLAQLREGEAKDDALMVAARYWSGRELDFATTSLSAIGDAKKRQCCQFAVYQTVSGKDQAKADTWLAAQGFSAEVRDSWKALASEIRE